MSNRMTTRPSLRGALAGLAAGVLLAGLAGGAEQERPAWVPLSPQAIGGPWAMQGPGPSQNGQLEGIPNRPVTGAVNALAPHPTNADVLYLGAVNGGIWKTTNATAAAPAWSSQTDAFGSLSIGRGALHLDPTDATANTVVAGIGRSSSFGGAGGSRLGILRTTDGGASWTLLNGGGVLTGKNAAGIAARGAVLVLAVNTSDSGTTLPTIGIFRSTNTGTSFTQVSGTGGLPQGRAFDLAGDPSNNAILYTAIRDAGAGNGVYKSTDTGATWTRVSDAAIDALIRDTAPTTSNVRISVGAANNVYVAIANTGRLAGLFRSGSGGGTWASLDLPTTNEGGTPFGIHPGGQGGTHFSLVASRANANLVFVGGDRQPGSGDPGGSFPNSIGAVDYSGRLFRVDASLTPGSQAAPLTHSGAAGNSAPHADSRQMVIDANGDVLEGDDGGVYRRVNPGSSTGAWVSVNGTLVATEFHNIAFDSNTNTIFGGAQDNGTPQQQAAGNPTWVSISTADGGDVSVDDTTTAAQSVRYSSYQVLQVFARRTYNASNVLVSTQFPALTVTSGAALQAQFVTPVQVNARTQTRLIIGGANGAYESFNRGDTLAQISTTGVNANGIAYGGRRLGVDNPDVVYVGSGSQVQLRTSGSGSLTPSATYPGGTVRGVTMNPEDWQEAIVVDTAAVYRTTDAGASWSNITFNLASFNPGSLRSVSYVAVGPNAVLVGADRGAYGLKLNTTTWDTLGTGMPNAPVYELDYDAARDKLVAGLLGRGAWLLTPLAPSVPVELGTFEIE
jgi:hypothetical protein